MKLFPAIRLTGIFLLLAGLNAAAFGQGDTQKPTIFVCGDSTSKFNGGETMDNLAARNGKSMAGWGTPIGEFFDPAKVTVNNVGHAGTSSMSYYNGDWPRVLPQIKSGDYVLIVFGINDGSTPNGIGDEVIERPVGRRGGRGPATAPGADGAPAPAPQTQSVHTYGWYMSKMATDARDKGAHVYFLTVTARNMWTNTNAAITYRDATPNAPLPPDYDPKQDHIERGTGKGVYTQWTKDVGAKIRVPVFDLTNYCADLYEEMGREKVNQMYNDHNHTYIEGATTVARCIVAGLKGFKDSPFVAMLSDEGRTVPPADAKYISDNQP